MRFISVAVIETDTTNMFVQRIFVDYIQAPHIQAQHTRPQNTQPSIKSVQLGIKF
jgi:hypothetical protein